MLPVFRIFALASLLLVTLTSNAQLAGTYTIDDGGGGDYTTFTAAVSDLTTLGVSAPVVFEVLPGTYTEQVSIPAITGSSATNTISFAGQTMDSSDVVLTTPTGGLPYTVELNGVDFITFSYMSIVNTGTASTHRAINIVNGSNDWAFRNCRLSTSAVSSANVFNIVSSSIGDSHISACFIERGPVVANGVSTGSLSIVKSDFQLASRCVDIDNFDGEIFIRDNTILANGAGTSIRPIDISFSDPAAGAIERNWIKGVGTAPICIRFRSMVPAGSNRFIIANNAIISDATGGLSSRGIWTVSTVGQIDILNNSISTDQSGSNSRAIYAQTGAFDLRIHNNALRAYVHPLFVPVGSMTSSDHNVFHSVSGSGVDIGPLYTSTAALFAATGTNGNSIFTDPLFVDNANNLHLQLGSPCLGAGSAFGGIADDIDEETRPQPIGSMNDIGSDEHPVGCAALAGTYIIGGSGAADYATFNDAVGALTGCGISAPVVFEIESGTYTEQVSIPAITGSSATNTITFIGQTMDSTDVVLTWATSGPNYTVEWDGVDHITFSHLTIQRTSSTNSNVALAIASASADWNVLNCRFVTNAVGTNIVAHGGLVYSGATTTSVGDALIQNCAFEQGGIVLTRGGVGTFTVTDNVINNTGGGGCIYLVQIQGVTTVSDNELTSVVSNSLSSPIRLATITSPTSLLIQRNRIRSSGSGFGSAIYSLNVQGTASAPVVFRNNEIISSGTSGRGIWTVSTNSHIHILNNSIAQVPGREGILGQTGASNITLHNNAIIGQTRPAQFPAGAVISADHNVFHSITGQAPISAGVNANSITADPLFVDNANDLHLQAGSPCLGAGSTFGGIADDIDEEMRPQPVGSMNDIGADEHPVGCAALAGTYIIGGSGAADYVTFNDAVGDLTGCGISAPVVFEVESGTYTEQVFIPAITGSSATNTITFTSQTMDSTDVVLTWATSGLNYTVQWDGVDHITFSHLTIERMGSGTSSIALAVTSASTDWNVLNCRFVTNTVATNVTNQGGVVYTGSSASVGEAFIQNCAFDEGGIRLVGGGTGTFTVTNNVVDKSGGGNCIYLSQIQGVTMVSDNQLTGTANSGSLPVRLISITNPINLVVQRNRIKSSGTSSAIYLLNVQATPGAPVVFRNNEIISSGTGGRGIWTVGTNSHIHILNNSIAQVPGQEGILGQTGASNITLHNNAILAQTRPVHFFPPGAVISGDHNVFHSLTGQVSISAGVNANSITADPLFVDNTNDLHLQNGSPCHSTGSTFGGVTQDLDGESRPQPIGTDPDIGADEDPWVCVPLAGTYVIGSSSGADYIDFNSAVNAMAFCGISGPVLFEVENGVYTERLELAPIDGTSAVNTITFRGQALDSTLVTLQAPAGNNSFNDHVIRFEGVDYISWEYMTFDRTGGGLYQRLIEYPFLPSEVSQYTAFRNCRFIGGTAAISTNYCIQSNNTNLEVRTEIQQCNFTGYRGVIWDASSMAEMLIVEGNTFANTNNTLHFLNFADSLTVRFNTITGSGTKIDLSGINAPFLIAGNQVNAAAGLSIRLTNCSLSAGAPGWIKNNSIIGGVEAFFLAGVNNYIRIVNNSASSSATRVYHDSGSGNNLWLQNNVFRSNSSSATAYVLWKQTSSVYTNTSNNVLYRVGSSGFARWNNIFYTDLGALQAGSGQFANSIQADPMFLDPLNDLHIQTGSPCAGTGVLTPSVNEDLDQEMRPQPALTAPDIGMDETPEFCEVLSGTYIIGSSAAADFTDFTTAVNRMSLCGISGPVVFEVEDGTYNGQISVPAVVGNSATNTISFIGQNMDSSSVILDFPSANGVPNYVVELAGADYVSFAHMTLQRSGPAFQFGHVIAVDESSTDWAFHNCALLSNASTASASEVLFYDAVVASSLGISAIQNCRLVNGGVSMRDVSGGSFQFEENTVDHDATGLEFSSFSGSLYCVGNELNVATLTSTFGINLDSGTPGVIEISKNSIKTSGSGSTNIRLDDISGTAADPIRIANNMLINNRTLSSSQRYTVRLFGTAGHVDLFNNSMTCVGNGTALGITTSGSVTHNLRIHNNAIFTQAIPLLVFAGLTSSDNNVFHSEAFGGVSVNVNGVNYNDLPSLIAGSGTNANSRFADPVFVDNANDLHLQLGSPCLGNGSTFGGIADDIDNEPRPQPAGSNNDIGADEHPASTCGLSGVYVIGSSGAADYPNFNAAVADLSACGISASVIFEVENGTYTEQIDLGPVDGTSATSTITFRGQALDSSLVTLRHLAGTSSFEDFVINMAGGDHITFEHMTLNRYAGSTSRRFGIIVNYPSGSGDASEYTTFRNIRFIGSYATNTGFYPPFSIGIASNNMEDEMEVNVLDCRFQTVGRSFDWNQNGQDDQLSIVGCEIASGYHGPRFTGFDHDLMISGNSIVGLFSSSTIISGMEFVNCNGGVLVERNEIFMTVRGYGIQLNNTQATAANPFVLRNNTIILTNAALNFLAGFWIRGTNADYIDVINNSVSVRLGRAFYEEASTGSGNRVVNNIFRSEFSGGYAFYKSGTGVTYSQLSHNVLHQITGPLAFWSSAQTNLVDLQAASSAFANSVQGDPGFVNSLSDLHLQSGSICTGIGDNTVGIVSDVDDEVRPQPAGSLVDIGADETPEFCIDLSGTYVIGSSGGADFPDFSSAVSQMEKCGISGPVVFNVEPGTYVEQISLGPIFGNTFSNTITFQGQTGDSTDVILQWNTSFDANADYVVLMNGADHLTFKDLTISRTGSSSSSFWAAAIAYEGTDPSVNTSFEHVQVLSVSTSSSTRHTLIREDCTADLQEVKFSNCLLRGGYTGMEWNCDGTDQITDITDCVFELQRNALVIRDLGSNGSSLIQGNRMNALNTSSLARAIELVGGQGPHNVFRNQIRMNGIPITLTNLLVGPGNASRIANNELVSLNNKGVDIAGNSAEAVFANNSISASSEALTTTVLASNIQLLNNIFHTTLAFTPPWPFTQWM